MGRAYGSDYACFVAFIAVADSAIKQKLPLADKYL
jgi:hypothetical protein